MNSKIIKRLDALPGWLSIHEGQFLHKAANRIKNKSGVIVEIGSFQGKSTIYLAKTDQQVFAIDPHEGKLDHGTKIPPTLVSFQKNIADFKVKNNVSLIRKTSYAAVRNWNKKIKLLFIDGLHDAKNARFDYDNWSPFLIDGGVVAMHDSFCGWEGAQNIALNRIVLNSMYSEVGVVGSIIYGIKGNGNTLTLLNRVRVRILILTAFWINTQKWLSKPVSFFLIHRLIKLLLLNSFTFKRAS